MADEGLVPASYSQTSSHHAALILEQLNVQRYYGAFCDIVLRVEDVDVRLHKCVLAASSARLQSMVYGMRQECGDLLTLKDVSLPGFWPILDYVYTGVLKLDTGSVQEVLLAAQLLEIRDVEKICLEYIKLLQANNAASNGTTASHGDVKDLPPPPLFTITGQDGALSGQYITPISPAPPPPHLSDKHHAMTPATPQHQMMTTPVQSRAPSMPSTPAPIIHQPATPIMHQPSTPAPQMPSTPAPSLHQPGTPAPNLHPPGTPGPNLQPVSMHQPATPNMQPSTPQMHQPGTPAPSIHQPGTPAPSIHQPGTPAPLVIQPGTPAPNHQSLDSTQPATPGPQDLSRAHTPSHLSDPVVAPSGGVSYSQPTYSTGPPPDQPYMCNPLPPPRGGFPGMPIDTNYVEDYLKLIESFQGEQPPPLPPGTNGQYTATSSSSAPRMSAPPPPPSDRPYPAPPSRPPDPAPPSTPRDYPTVPPPPIYQGPLPPKSSASCSTTVVASEGITTSVPGPVMAPSRRYPRTTGASNPISQMSAEEVRRTVLNVLSKFDDEEDEEEEDEGKKTATQVPPLTSFLNFAPLTAPSKTDPSGAGLYGDLQIVSSEEDEEDSDLSDEHDALGMQDDGPEDSPDLQRPSMFDGRLHTATSALTNGAATTDGALTNEIITQYGGTGMQMENGALYPGKDGLLNRIKKSTYDNNNLCPPSSQTPGGGPIPGGQLLSVADIGVPASEVPKKRGRHRNAASTRRGNVSETVFKDTMKDPSMANRPLKKRIRLRLKKKYQCMKCAREFVRPDALEAHIAQHENSVLHACHVCSQKFARVSELTRHQRDHAKEVFSCQQCDSPSGAEFSSAKLYKQHMDTVHKVDRAFYCKFPGCEYRANKLSNLEKHMPIHADMKRYHCPNCGKNFAQPNGLRSHRKSCQQERGYLCDICGAKFNYLQSMKSHRLLHTGEKPYSCEECGAKFTDPRNMKRHRRIHDNTFPYQCDRCDKRFRHSNSLKAHQNTHDRSKRADDVKPLVRPPPDAQTDDYKQSSETPPFTPLMIAEPPPLPPPTPQHHGDGHNHGHTTNNHGHGENHGHLSDNHGHLSDSHGHLSDNHGHLSDNHGHLSDSHNHGYRLATDGHHHFVDDRRYSDALTPMSSSTSSPQRHEPHTMSVPPQHAGL